MDGKIHCYPVPVDNLGRKPPYQRDALGLGQLVRQRDLVLPCPSLPLRERRLPKNLA